MGPLALPRLTPDDYLSLERDAPTRSEYHDGTLVALAGGTWEHNVIVDNVSAAINSRVLSRSCRAVTSDQKVWVPRTSRFLYPDVVVVCGPPTFQGDQRDALLNPVLIVEVLSKSTEGYDRGDKFGHYRTIDTLLEYVLVAQDFIRISPSLPAGVRLLAILRSRGRRLYPRTWLPQNRRSHRGGLSQPRSPRRLTRRSSGLATLAAERQSLADRARSSQPHPANAVVLASSDGFYTEGHTCRRIQTKNS